jgi:hypothetical protein
MIVIIYFIIFKIIECLCKYKIELCKYIQIDKPIISVDNGEYSFQFEDSMSFNFESKSLIDQYDRINKHQYHEYFYWTPDLPQLVIKQCQVVKQICDNDLIFKLLFVQSLNSIQEKFMAIIHYIYPPHVNEIRDRFATGKVLLGLNASQHAWFHETMDNDINGKFNDMVKYTRYSIDDSFFYNSNKNAIKLFKGKKYIL